MNVSEILEKLSGLQIKLAKSKRVPIEFPQIKLKETYKVESTMNYGMFKIMQANRDIGHPKAILKCILAVGYIPMPIIVNEFFEIVDGQNRFMALKELGYPIFYMMIPGLRIAHVRNINYAMWRWRQDEFIKSYSHDHVDYAYLNNLKKQFPRYTEKVLDVAAGKSLTGGSIGKTIKSGRYTMTTEQYEDAMKTLTWLESFSDYTCNKKIVGGRTEQLFIAMIFAYRNKSVDKRKFESQFRAFADKTERKEMSLQAVGDIRDCLKRLENIYNFNSVKAKRVFLLNDYDKAANEKRF